MKTLILSFAVTIECRPCGAIGVFSPRVFHVSAATRQGAETLAFNEAQDSGNETRFILSTVIV